MGIVQIKAIWLWHWSAATSKSTREGHYARARVSLVSWEGGSHVVLFMVPLSYPRARPMDQALQLPFEYYYYYCDVYTVTPGGLLCILCLLHYNVALCTVHIIVRISTGYVHIVHVRRG